MLGGIGVQEMLLIFLAVLLLFGAKRIPQIAQSLGKGYREFRTAIRQTQDEFQKTVGEINELGNKSPNTNRTGNDDSTSGKAIDRGSSK